MRKNYLKEKKAEKENIVSKIMKNSIKEIWILLIIISVLICGVILVTIPIILYYRTNFEISDSLKKFEVIEESENDVLKNEMMYYNANLANGAQKQFETNSQYENPEFVLSEHGIDNNEILGKIIIPCIDIELALYNGVKNLNKGATCWGNTSLPLGGENTNTVISAHNKFNGNNMFINIDKLKIGDDIFIQNFWEKLHYKVVYYAIINNDDFSYSYISHGKEIITLNTCYKFPKKDHRYVVIAERYKN